MKSVHSKEKRSKIHRTVVIIFRKRAGKEGDSILMGLSLNRFCKGYEIQPGGHIEDEDGADTCCHEGPDECGLKPDKEHLKKIGTFVVRYEDGRVVIMHYYETFRWTGVLVPNPKDFKSLKFLTRAQIAVAKVPPGDLDVLNAILSDRWFDAEMRCGKDLSEFISFTMRTRPRTA